MCDCAFKNIVSNIKDKANYYNQYVSNSWGILNDGNEIWIANNKSGTITHCDIYGNPKIPTKIDIPFDDNSNAKITSMIFNNSDGFIISNNSNSASADIIYVTADGLIGGYNKLVNEQSGITIIDNSANGSIYTGIAQIDDKIYVTDFKNKRIEIYDHNFVQITNIQFIDNYNPKPLPDDYSPFNIVHISNKLYVLYAKIYTKDGDPNSGKTYLEGIGNGIINIFKPNGYFVDRFTSYGKLNVPWDLFQYKNKIYISNHGNGKILIYSRSGKYCGSLKSNYSCCNTIKIFGIWSIFIKCGSIYWTSGPNNETNGIVGKIKLTKCDCH